MGGIARAGHPASPRRPPAFRAYGLVAVPVVAHLVLAWRRRWMQEDGFIDVRIVQQLLAGHGPVFNAGERVEAYTSPLWIAILAVLRIVTLGSVSIEWLAVVSGIGLAVIGTVGLVAGAVSLWTPPGQESRRARWLPFGALVLIALPPLWDFSSSGLENGLALGWFGTSFALVARSQHPDRLPRARTLVLLLGLGPLIRPEMVLYSAGLIATLVIVGIRPRRRVGTDASPWWTFVVAGGAIPLGYQIFRMGFFAAAVPNTALAKNAANEQWGQGWRYLTNFTGPYVLVIPLLVVLAAAVGSNLRWTSSRLVVAFGVVVPALLNGLYVVAIGGDYMHARFLLLPLAALMAPLAAVPIPDGLELRRFVPRLGAVVALAIWAVATIGWWRPPLSDHGVDDEHHLFTASSGHSHPIHPGDQPPFFVDIAARFKAHVGQDVFLDQPEPPAPLGTYQRPRGSGLAVQFGALGIVGDELGPRVFLFDYLGLADPIASRMAPVLGTRAGHTHDLPRPWRLARAGVGIPGDQYVAAARRAMECGALGRYLAGISGPLTPGRFLVNIWRAVGNTELQVPTDPTAAAAEFCGPG